MKHKNQILRYVAERKKTPQGWLTSNLDIDKGELSRKLGKLEEENLIKREKEGREKIVKLDSKGKDEVINKELNSSSPTPGNPQQLPGRHNDVECFDFHKNSIKVPIDNLDELKKKFGDSWSDWWARGWLESEGMKYQENRENNTIVHYADDWEFWFTENYVFVKLPDWRCDPGSVFRKCQSLMAKGAEALDWLEDNTPVRVDRSSASPQFSIREGHMAIAEEALAQLVCEHPDTNLNNFKIFIDGELRLWIDNSDGEKHLETRQNGHGPEDLDFIFNEVYRSFIDSKDGWREVVELAESDTDVSELPSRVNKLENEITSIVDSISNLSKGVDSLTSSVSQVVEHNNADNSQASSSVMEQSQGQDQQLERILQALETSNAIASSSDERIVEMLEQIKQAINVKENSYDDPVQKVFMETWKDDSYSRPWFQHGHLKAWKKEGGNKKCEVVLDKETIEKLKS